MTFRKKIKLYWVLANDWLNTPKEFDNGQQLAIVVCLLGLALIV